MTLEVLPNSPSRTAASTRIGTNSHTNALLCNASDAINTAEDSRYSTTSAPPSSSMSFLRSYRSWMTPPANPSTHNTATCNASIDDANAAEPLTDRMIRGITNETMSVDTEAEVSAASHHP